MSKDKQKLFVEITISCIHANVYRLVSGNISKSRFHILIKLEF
jgi:hypothetical protein